MSERIDHAAEARVWADNAVKAQSSQISDPWGTLATAYASIAQVQATLALVEQQRIANLIALAGLPNINGFENEIQDAATEALMEGLLDSKEVAAVPGYGPAGIDEQVFIRPEIKEALGL